MAEAPAAPRIFVSYAQSDGKEIAAELRRRLQDEHGFPLWQDVKDMEGGKDWWLQITDAINHVEFLVLVMTPAALASPIVRKEWRYARQEGKCVIPVIGGKGIDFGSLPGWMRRTHFIPPDEPDQWRRFVRTLKAPCKATRAPFMVEDLPQVFVRRPRELEQLVTSLLDQSGEEPLPITAALKGAGGYGKTTLARAICHEEAIQKAFADGILWVTLGEQPGDIQSRVVELIEVLTSERPGFTTLDAAVTRLGEVIGERHMLIVVDDVWQAAHARPFLQAGPNCARLITTRNRDSLQPNAKPLEVDAMEAGQAINLLRFDLPDGEDATFAKLAHRLGEWPLLLKLVNGALHKRIAAGQPLAAALASVNAGLDSRGLTVFDARNPVDRGDAVAKTLGVSFELFTDDERTRFSELGIFPEDVDLPLTAVETLWSRTGGLDEFATEHLCTRLYDQSLVFGLDLATRRMRLHDVIRGYLQAEQKERLPTLHAELIEAYRALCADGWHAGPDDGYFFQHLPYHLAEAGQADERRVLLFDYRWLRRKLEVAGVNRLIEDLAPLQGDTEARKLAGSLRLSAHVLNHQPRQLAGQLLGRLSSADGPAIGALLGTARTGADRPSLMPLRVSLTPPGGPLLVTLEGHGAEVGAVAVTPDGRRAVSGSLDETFEVWDLEQGVLLSTLEGHNHSAVAVTPDGRRAVSGSENGTLKVWDLEQGALLATLASRRDRVSALAVTPDGRRAVSGSEDGTLKVWDLEQGTLIATLAAHRRWVRAVAVTPDGRRAVSGSEDWTLKVWDLEEGVLLATLGNGDEVTAVAVTPDGRRTVSGSEDGTLKAWDLDKGVQLATLKGHHGPVRTVAVMPDGRRAASGSLDTTLKVWDLEQGSLITTLEGHDHLVAAVAVTPDGQRAVSGSYDRTLKVWDLEQGALLATLAGHRVGALALAVTPDGRRAVLGLEDETLKVWDLEHGALLASLGQPRSVKGARAVRRWKPPMPVTAVAVMLDGRRAVSGSYDGMLKVWDLEQGALLGNLRGGDRPVSAVAVTPDGRRAVSGSFEGMFRVWDLEQGALLTTLEGHGHWTAVAVTPDGRRAVSGSYDRTLKVWDLEQGALLATLERRGDRVYAVAVTPDARRVVSGLEKGRLKVWDLERKRGALLTTLEGHDDRVRVVAVTPDGRHAVSGSEDRRLKLWDLATGHELAIFTGDANFSCCAVTPDGRFVVAGDMAAQIHVLEILL
jgi:WD40 repeat protein